MFWSITRLQSDCRKTVHVFGRAQFGLSAGVNNCLVHGQFTKEIDERSDLSGNRVLSVSLLEVTPFKTIWITPGKNI